MEKINPENVPGLTDTTIKDELIEKVEELLPPISPESKKERQDLLDYQRSGTEARRRAPVVSEITVGNIELYDELDLGPLFLVNMLASGEWANNLMSDYYGEDIYDQYIRETDDSPEKRMRRLSEIREELGNEEFNQMASRYINETLENQLDREVKHSLGTLDFGLEVEILPLTDDKEKETIAERIDSLQALGIPVSYDGLREIELPKSDSMHRQLQGLVQIAKILEIAPELKLSIHLNVGNLSKLDSDMFLLLQIMEAANMFECEYPAGVNIRAQNEWGMKPLYEDDPNSPQGLPFRVKSNGVVELRRLPELREANSTAKGLLTTGFMLEAIAAKQRLSAGTNYEGNEKDVLLRNLWEALKTDALNAFHEYDVDQEKLDYFFTNADDFNLQMARIRNNVTKETSSEEEQTQNYRRQNQMYRLLIEYRKQIRDTLQSYSN